MLFPNLLIDRINVGKILRPFAEDKLFTALLKPAIKWLRKLECANRRGFCQWFAERKTRGTNYEGFMQLADILGWIATMLFTVCYIPQIIKTFKTQTIEGLSFWLLFVSFMANIVALCYATLIQQSPLQIKYILALFFLGICICQYLKVFFRGKQNSTCLAARHQTSTLEPTQKR